MAKKISQRQARLALRRVRQLEAERRRIHSNFTEADCPDGSRFLARVSLGPNSMQTHGKLQGARAMGAALFVTIDGDCLVFWGMPKP